MGDLIDAPGFWRAVVERSDLHGPPVAPVLDVVPDGGGHGVAVFRAGLGP